MYRMPSTSRFCGASYLVCRTLQCAIMIHLRKCPYKMVSLLVLALISHSQPCAKLALAWRWIYSMRTILAIRYDLQSALIPSHQLPVSTTSWSLILLARHLHSTPCLPRIRSRINGSHRVLSVCDIAIASYVYGTKRCWAGLGPHRRIRRHCTLFLHCPPIGSLRGKVPSPKFLADILLDPQ